MNIDKVIKTFPDFLNKSWSIIHPLLLNRTYTSDESSINDWIQSNWELLIERKILPLDNHLEVYGEGADFNGKSSRITDANALPTHSLKVSIINGKDILNNCEIQNEELQFEKFTGFKNGFYAEEPPFNFVLLKDDKNIIERVFITENVKFKLHKINTK